MTFILTDCDGVLLNWKDSFDSWMMREQGLYAKGDVTVYDQSIRYDIDKDYMNVLIRAFNSSANVGFLPPLYDSVKYVKKLHEEHGYQLIIISSLSNNPFAQELRTRNLRSIFGRSAFSEFVYLDTGEDKDEVLQKYAEYYPGVLWIEDKTQNALLGRKLGLDSVLMKHIYHKNEDTDELPIMSSWKELYNRVTGE